jgi:hypothetical protein
MNADILRSDHTIARRRCTIAKYAALICIVMKQNVGLTNAIGRLHEIAPACHESRRSEQPQAHEGSKADEDINLCNESHQRLIIRQINLSCNLYI